METSKLFTDFYIKRLSDDIKEDLLSNPLNIKYRLIYKIINNNQKLSFSKLPKINVKYENKNIKKCVLFKSIILEIKKDANCIYNLTPNFIIDHQNLLCDITFKSNLTMLEKRKLLHFIEEQCHIFNK